jgi:hypothetical protein
MEFNFNIDQIFKGEVISIWDAKKLNQLSPLLRGYMTQIIDNMGRESAEVQGLPQTITSMAKMISSDHRLYIFADGV